MWLPDRVLLVLTRRGVSVKKLKLRPKVVAFAQAMERKLRKNDDKGGWSHCGTGWLLGRLLEEVYELADLARVDAVTLGMLGIVVDRVRRFQPTMKAHAAVETIRDEAADVANFTMMLTDVCGGLQ